MGKREERTPFVGVWWRVEENLGAGRKHCRSQAGRSLCSVLEGVKVHLSCPIQVLQPPSSDNLQHKTAGDAQV